MFKIKYKTPTGLGKKKWKWKCARDKNGNIIELDTRKQVKAFINENSHINFFSYQILDEEENVLFESKELKYE